MQRKRDDGGFLGRPAWLWSLGALLLGLLATAAAASLHQDTLARSERAQLALAAERSFTAVQAQLHNCGLLVRTVQALFLASDEVTTTEFDAVYANLRPNELFPGLQALAYSERRPGAAGGRDAFISTMVAPKAGNERLIGFDVGSQPANLRGILRSAQTDQPVMSAAFTLVQRLGLPGPSDGITIRLPVYSTGGPPSAGADRGGRFVGTVGASFQVSGLIERALPPQTRESMDVRVVDVTDGQRWPLFVSMRMASSSRLPGQDYRFSRDLRFGGRTWRMELTGQPATRSAFWLPLLTVASGLLASVLLASLAWTVANTRARALVLARRMTAQYHESEARFRALNESLPALVLLARSDGRLVYANQSARERLALPDPASVDLQLGDLVGDEEGRDGIVASAAGRPLRNLALRLGGEGHEPFWATLSVSPIDLEGVPHLLAVANDITELRDLNQMLSYQAAHDPLTGLYNRREFGRRLDAALAALDAGGPPCALLYFDLDQFKIINDTSGHNVGDQLLSQLAGLLGSHLVEGETLARLGGDEFGILLEPATREQALAFAERMRLEIDGFVFSSEQRLYAVSVSVGLVLLDRPGLSQREVLSLADTACYMAKERGRNRVQLYSEQDAGTLQRRSEMEWASRLRQALIDGRFILHYQALQALQAPGPTDAVHIELLLRLRDEDGVMVPPGAFIPAAERFGLMLQLDRWVVDTALSNFQHLHAGGLAVDLCAINLSAQTVEDDGFAEFVLERLQRYQVPAHRVCFEITETAAVASMIRVVELMGRLRKAGCRFSLDDFGAGMASFGYLKNLPVDYVKIDGSFIRNLETDPISASIVRAVTDIGHQLGLKVVAEWVGDERTVEILRAARVDYAQGFHVHRPELAAFMR
jgi:diguanylate cyclase (GGDEF)-like protein